jgi:hypothetical protein
MREIAIGVVKRADEGSCNACQDHSTEKVLLIRLSMLSFRLCLECARKLRADMIPALVELADKRPRCKHCGK